MYTMKWIKFNWGNLVWSKMVKQSMKNKNSWWYTKGTKQKLWSVIL